MSMWMGPIAEHLALRDARVAFAYVVGNDKFWLHEDDWVKEPSRGQSAPSRGTVPTLTTLSPPYLERD